MPFFDRFWWLKLADGAIHLALGIASLVWAIATNAGVPGDAGDSAVALCGGIALLTVGIGIGLVISADRGRRRKLARLAAISGDAEAVPAARMRLPRGPTADVATEPLVLAWRAKASARTGALIGVAVFVSSLAAVLVRVGALSLQGIITLAQATPTNLLPYAVIALLCTDLILLPGSNLPLRPVLFGSRIWASASDEGVRFAAPLRRPQFVAWSDARLLEVGQSGAGTASLWSGGRHFTLYGTSGVVQWHDKTGFGGLLTPSGAAPNEQAERAAALLSLVHTRTGLVPRTFDKSLLPPPPITTRQAQPAGAAPRKGLSDRLSRLFGWMVLVVVLGGFAVGLLVLAAAVALVPLTTSPALNVLIAVAIGLPTIAGVVLLGVRVRGSGGLAASTTAEPELSVTGAQPASIQVAPDVVYTYTVAMGGMRLRTRLLAASFGALCTILLLPAIIGILTAVHSPLPGGVQLADAGAFQVDVAVLLAIPGILGPLLLLVALLPHRPGHRRTIHAGPDALEADGLRIAWDHIEGVDVVRIGDTTAYVVHAISASSPIIWSAGSSAGSTALPGPGVHAVTARQLAEIVAQCSGVPLTAREMA